MENGIRTVCREIFCENEHFVGLLENFTYTEASYCYTLKV